ncbi:MAG: PhzF family phenazine biosynthesis protein [Oscillospiraceae bacterium]|nr:PhzF family phenazine biosynthesis protein [Oscillospiraceae bacterium]
MVQVYVVSAFSKDNKGGNKAGVVLNREYLCPKQKMAIAKELGYSETVFILPCKAADFELQPDFEKMAQLNSSTNTVGIHAFALTEGGEISAVCRNFAPLYGIDEESATGTASCALACYLYKHLEKKEEYIFEQGYSLNLPSRIAVKLHTEENEIKGVFVGGYGYLEEEKTLDI